MIEISKIESSVYTCIKRGAKETTALRLSLNMSAQAIRNAVLRLQSYGMVEIKKEGRCLYYSAITKSHKVKKKELDTKITGEGIPRGTFDLSSYNISFTYDQISAIEVYKKDKTYKGDRMERTQFAKEIKAPKLYVTFALGAMK